jgi:hypothetical protein
MYRNLRVLSWDVFQSLYGTNVYSHIGPDNTRYLACIYKLPIMKPYVRKKQERLSLPKKNDRILIVNSSEELLGNVVFTSVSDDDIGVYIWSTKKLETFSLSCVETYREGKVSWKIEG